MDTMSPNERIDAAVALKKPDRVPVVPIIDAFAASYGGISGHDMFFNMKKNDEALQKTLDDLGYIDAQHQSWAGLGNFLLTIFPVPPQLPGVGDIPDDGQFQFVEKSVMEPEDYKLLAQGKLIRFMWDTERIYHPEFNNPLKLLTAGGKTGLDLLNVKRSLNHWHRRGVESTVGFNMTFIPMEGISMAFRSFNDFITDLFRRPEDVKAASKALLGPLTWLGYLLTKLSGIKRIFLGGTRTSASFISPKQFEEFALPEWKHMCEFFVRRGITPMMHLDSDWTPFFPYFKELPARKCVLNLDGSSDIFKAKEILGDHMCIMGDVPASLLKLGEPEEVDEYCKKLIEVVGEDGGFILSSGCTLPPDAKPENVKVMFESVHKYGKYK